MKAEAHVTKKIVLVLDEKEAKFVRDYTQNSLTNDESESHRNFRENLWTTLNDVLRG